MFDKALLARLKREEFRENNIERIINEFNECMLKIGDVTFIMEGDSNVDDSRKFVWDRYGKEIYIQTSNISKLMTEVIENW